MQKELFWAQKGKGAFLNGAPIRVTQAEQLKNCLVGFDMGYNEEQGQGILEVARLLWPHVHSIRLLGSGAIGLAYVACGRLGLYFHRYLFPWDVASGILLVQEAGGMVEAWDHQPITLTSRSVIASSPLLINKFHHILSGAAT
jgi:myo-inositol-1(or 4)-monophosphatase